jgi:hypothetical protein
MSNAFKIPKNKLLFLRQKTVFGVFCFLVLLNIFNVSAFANTSASATASVIPTPSGGGGGGLFSPPLSSEAKRTDANKDNRVDFLDFNILMANWGAVGPNVADFNGDGVIDLFDFNLLMIYWTG